MIYTKITDTKYKIEVEFLGEIYELGTLEKSHLIWVFNNYTTGTDEFWFDFTFDEITTIIDDLLNNSNYEDYIEAKYPYLG